ncbi:MAG: dTDP-4-dehydrorhamnose reductase [Anaerolineales bacterium]|nr:dTDP-4-dehydrorhamnose reductase [Anaerolineales bacterium]
MWKILLLGKIGQLGFELQRTLAPLGEVTALDYPDIDFTKPETLTPQVAATKPNVIINAVAYTDVDKAETEIDIANAINGEACGVLAKAAKQLNAPLIHFSTDFVFDGRNGGSYCENDAVNPLNVYGKSKRMGEEAILAFGKNYLILRTSWLYSMRRETYVLKVLRWARTQPKMRVVTDQTGSPTSARILAEITAQALAVVKNRGSEWLEERRGVYHLAGDGTASRFEFAQTILSLDPRREEQIVTEILPAISDDFPTPARRPGNTSLNCDKFERAFSLRLPPWQEALRLELTA